MELQIMATIAFLIATLILSVKVALNFIEIYKMKIDENFSKSFKQLRTKLIVNSILFAVIIIIAVVFKHTGL